MLFTSLEFVALVGVTFIIFYSLKSGIYQSVALVVSSLFFYAWHYPALLILLLSSIIINTIASYYVFRLKGSTRRLVAIVGVTTNLALLAFFKYGPLLGKTFFSENSSIADYLIAIPLPIGISFFTFEGISLLVDSFKRQTKENFHSPLNYFLNVSLFISFFPHLIAGPILKAHEFMPQIRCKRIADIDVDFFAKKVISGYFLKMVIADNLKDQTFWMAYPYFESFSGLDLIGLLLGYSIQIFADFAGYSLIAIGIAAIFGYRLNENFLFPYISTTFSEFWQRWHISLSTFLKEYLYIPLGGNRKGSYKTYRNLLLTMTLGGLWHGAAWSYAIWGIYHGLALVIERYISQQYTIKTTLFYSILKGCLVFSIVSLGWLFFKLPVISEALLYIKLIFVAPFYSTNKERLLLILLYSSPVILYHLLYVIKSRYNLIIYPRVSTPLYATMLFLILLNRGSSGDFIYFQF